VEHGVRAEAQFVQGCSFVEFVCPPGEVAHKFVGCPRDLVHPTVDLPDLALLF